jgi:tetratricopeptide (TPR) repeat protein
MTDNRKNAPVSNPSSEAGRLAFENCMRSEEERILRGAQFHSSPTLARLLKWLVTETLAGRGDLIKSYRIAVEGLGRPEEFDSQADSYPRVQIGRLRKALQIHYAQQSPAQELCLYLQPGSYRIRLGRLEHAYPQLYRPISQETQLLDFIEEPIVSKLPKSSDKIRAGRRVPQTPRSVFWAKGIAASVLLAALLFLSLALFSAKIPSTGLRNHSPVVVLALVEGGNKFQSAAIAKDIYAVLADGLSRSWVAQVRLGSDSDRSLLGSSPANYLLESQIVETAAGGQLLFVRLNDISSSTVVWSTTQPIDRSKSIMDNMGPVIAKLVGPYGAIARNEAALINDTYTSGYPCLLHYLSFLQSRNQILGTKVSRCLQEPSPETRLESVRLAFLAFYLMDSDKAAYKRGPRLEQALKISRQAAALDPKEAYAQFSLSRTYFIKNDCDSGRRYAQLAVAANPYDPIILAILGNFNSLCGYEEGFDMLNKAYQYRVGGESYARLSLILAAIRSNDVDRLPSLKDSAENMDGVGLAYHYLCETLIAAGLGDTPAARLEWKKFVAASPQPTMSADDMLRQLILADTARAKVIKFLTVKGVFVEA